MTSRRSEVLAALRAAGDDGLSGEVLAGRLGISRVAVGKHVSALRGIGYSIEARPGSGYRLIASPDLPLPDEVAPLLRSTAWTDLRGGQETASTNDDAKQLARAGAPAGTVVLAARQTAGRGRLGREWESPSGGVYLSCVIRPRIAVHDAPPLALAAAVGVARGLRALGADPSLKWPNDVLLTGDKLAGVLLEVSAEADALDWAVIGVGVNVSCPGAPPPGAAYLGDTLDPTPRLPVVAAAVLDGLAETMAGFGAGGFAALRDEYDSALALAGAEVTVRDLSGTVVASGSARGVDESGRLIVDGPEGPVAVVAGEVTLRG